MRVSRALIGKCVEVHWMDPQWRRIDIDSAPKGRAALATWREFGQIDDVTDGVVRIVHSAAASAGSEPGATDEIAFTPVPEALIEKIVVYQPAPELGS